MLELHSSCISWVNAGLVQDARTLSPCCCGLCHPVRQSRSGQGSAVTQQNHHAAEVTGHQLVSCGTVRPARCLLVRSNRSHRRTALPMRCIMRLPYAQTRHTSRGLSRVGENHEEEKQGTAVPLETEPTGQGHPGDCTPVGTHPAIGFIGSLLAYASDTR